MKYKNKYNKLMALQREQQYGGNLWDEFKKKVTDSVKEVGNKFEEATSKESIDKAKKYVSEKADKAVVKGKELISKAEEAATKAVEKGKELSTKAEETASKAVEKGKDILKNKFIKEISLDNLNEIHIEKLLLESQNKTSDEMNTIIEAFITQLNELKTEIKNKPPKPEEPISATSEVENTNKDSDANQETAATQETDASQEKTPSYMKETIASSNKK